MSKADQVMALYRARFPAFLRFAYRELNPTQPLIDTWHIDVLADTLERVARGDITRLIINLPPRTLKSLATSVALPVWMLGRDPTRKVMALAGTRELSREFETATASLLASPRCQALFPHLMAASGKGELSFAHGGARMSGVVGNSLVGRGADLIIIDDPIGAAYVQDPAKRRAVNAWFDAEVLQRLNDKRKGAVIVVMQRLHVEDLSGHLLGGEQPWTHLNLPAIAIKDETWPLAGGRTHQRAKGEPLAPSIDSKQQLFERMLDIGAYNFGAQYQQAPFEHLSPDEMRGGCFGGPDDEWGFPIVQFGRVSERAIMAYEVFGVGDHHPAMRPRNFTLEEFERYARWTDDYQRRLKLDPGARFGPPEGEAWPPDPNAVFEGRFFRDPT